MSEAVVLLSGGLDSATTLAIALDEGYTCYALTFNYGQKHCCEVLAAKRVAASFALQKHEIFEMNLSPWNHSALTGSTSVPKNQDPYRSEIPVTYVPSRNIIFLSIACSWAESLNISAIFMGVNAVDYSGYPDCRSEFIQGFEKAVNVGTKCAQEGKPFEILTPIIDLNKPEIIKIGASLGVDYSLTHSCYDPTISGLACGSCDSCIIRKNGFIQAQLPDPTLYAGNSTNSGL